MKKWNLLLILMLTIAALAGCSVSAAEKPAQTGVEAHYAFCLGIHDNAPVINLALIEDEIYEACLTYGSVTLVCSDGKPFSAFIDIPVQQEGLTDAKYAQIANDQCAQILNYAASMLARTEEVDTLGAIQLCVRSLNGVESETGNPVRRHLVVVDSCLSTTGTLSYLDSTLVDMDAEAIVSQLREKDEIPDFSGLEDVQVYNLGDVAGDQEPLSQEARLSLRNVWQAILEAGGARVYMRSDLPLSMEYEAGALPAVSPVAVEGSSVTITYDETADALNSGNAVTFGEETIKFLPGSAELADPDAAADALANVVTYMNTGSETLLVCGTTACWGGESYCLDLSMSRAETICALLENLGVDGGRLTPVGLGYGYAPFYTCDQSPDGGLDGGIAPLNRTVRLVLGSSELGADILNSL